MTGSHKCWVQQAKVPNGPENKGAGIVALDPELRVRSDLGLGLCPEGVALPPPICETALLCCLLKAFPAGWIPTPGRGGQRRIVPHAEPREDPDTTGVLFCPLNLLPISQPSAAFQVPPGPVTHSTWAPFRERIQASHTRDRSLEAAQKVTQAPPHPTSQPLLQGPTASFPRQPNQWPV